MMNAGYAPLGYELVHFFGVISPIVTPSGRTVYLVRKISAKYNEIYSTSTHRTVSKISLQVAVKIASCT
jgi:hypothetical protein